MITKEKLRKTLERNKWMNTFYMVTAASFGILGVFHYPFFLLSIIGFIGLYAVQSHSYFLVLSYQIEELKNGKKKRK